MLFTPQKTVFRTLKDAFLPCKSIPLADQKHSFYSPKAMLLQIENFEFSDRTLVSGCLSVGYTFLTQLSPESRICALAKKSLKKRENRDSKSVSIFAFFCKKVFYFRKQSGKWRSAMRPLLPELFVGSRNKSLPSLVVVEHTNLFNFSRSLNNRGRNSLRIA